MLVVAMVGCRSELADPSRPPPRVGALEALVPVALAPAPAALTVAVWMDGDNSLESLIPGDLDELEAGLGPGVSIVVQVDRIPGLFTGQGDWSGAKRVEIAADRRRGKVVSPVLEDLGEVDMGSGDALADFLLWTNERYPADRFALVLWNHGGGYWIAADDTDHDKIHIDDGELSDALQALVDVRGAKLDVVAFDACNMAEWEVAHALQDQVHVLTASEAWVGSKGYAYDQAFTGLPPDFTAQDLGDRLAWTAGDLDREWTHAAIDLDHLGELSLAVDGLAGAWLADPARWPQFRSARAAAHGLDQGWEEFWMDLGDLARTAAADPTAAPEVVASADAVTDALGAAVISNYTQPEVAFATGLTVFTDTTDQGWLDRYAAGSWAADTRWDELLAAVAADEH